MEPTSPPVPGGRLDSWKAIAAYLQRDVRTVRRWEVREGLPVHRHVHHKLASVYAYQTEVDAWFESRRGQLQPEPPAPGRSPVRTLAVAVGTLALAGVVVAALFARSSPAAPPEAAAVVGRLWAAASGEGQRPTIIQVGGLAIDLAITPDGRQIFVADRDRALLHVIRTDTNTLTDSIPLESPPVRLRVAPDGSTIYVATHRGDILGVHPRTKVVTTLSRGVEQVRDLAVTADGTRLYLTAAFRGLHVLDLSTGRLRDVPTVQCPMYLATAPWRDLMYVSYQCGGPGGRSGHDAIDVRSLRTGEALASIVGPAYVGEELALTPDGAQLWAKGHDACSAPAYDHVGCPIVPGGIVHIYRTDDNRRLTTLAMPMTELPDTISFFPDSSRAVISGDTPVTVGVASLQPEERAPFGLTGRTVFTPDGGRAYAPTLNRDAIAMFDLGAGRCAPPPPGLTIWWPGDGTPSDIRAGNTGELRNGAAMEPAWVGRGFAFDGLDDIVDVSALTNVDVSQSFSLVAWVKPEGTPATDQLLFDHAPPGHAAWRLTRTIENAVGFCQSTGDRPCRAQMESSVTSRLRLERGRWSHLVAVSTPGRLDLFIDGKPDASAASRPWPTQVGHAFRMGGPLGSGGYFSGMLDEVQIFNRGLTAAEIQRLHAAGRWGTCVR